MTLKHLSILAILATACTTSADSYVESRPSELVGTWLLLRPDSTWGDTTTWNAAGVITGSTNHPIPPDGQWVVRDYQQGRRVLCTRGGGESNCQPYTLNTLIGNTLIWGTGKNEDHFRKVVAP